jgi:CHASE3 domain sensor protein
VQSNIVNLHKLISDNKDQFKRINLLDKLVDNKLEELNKTIQLRKEENGFQKVNEIILTDEGKKIMDKIRVKNKEIEETELRKTFFKPKLIEKKVKPS